MARAVLSISINKEVRCAWHELSVAWKSTMVLPGPQDALVPLLKTQMDPIVRKE
jgi:hypothetical protein